MASNLTDRVPGAAGTWRNLTDNVNQLSATLTTQVRAIADVATAVTKGDLTRSIGVEASGEVAVLKDNINEMIRNLKETTQKNTEQDWLKTNLARFARMLQGQRDPMTVSKMILSELAPLVNAEHGVFYGMVGPNGSDVPADYVRITSGLGEAKPLNIIVLPVLFEGEVRAVIELASFQKFSPTHQDFLDQLMESIGIVLNNMDANSRTEELLKQSQSLANELQSQQDQLQRTNEELGEKARQLAQQMADNPDGNLLPKQTEYATIIRSSGTDLLTLINDILDLTKIESGKVALEITDWPLSELQPLLERTFRHVAEATKLGFTIDLRPGLPKTIPTDPQRLQQVLNNLLSNAFKFTEKGKVEFRAELATSGWSPTNDALNRAEAVIAMSVTDTGMGIPRDQQQTIFEAFAQGDGTTSRKYGGTGLGLSICRELTRLLVGEITLESERGVGSTFTLYLPIASPVVAWSGTSGDSTSNGSDGSSNGSPAPKVRAGASDAVSNAAPAIAVLDRPRAEIALKHVLVVEDEPVQRQRIVQLTEPLRATATTVATGEEAVAALEGQKFDCVVVDLGLPGMSGWQVVDHVRSKQNLRSTPVLVYTAKELTRKEVLKLGRASKTIVVKEVRSPERLQEEISAVLSKDSGDEVADSDTASIEISLAGKKVLVVDDDIRNIFALTALLERQGMKVVAVDSGADALKGDREKCIEAGASDYIAKPVDSSHLVGMLRSWLSH